MFEELFENKKICPEKLLQYGFVQQEEKCRYDCEVMDGSFHLQIYFDSLGNVDTVLTEESSFETVGEEYVLYKTSAPKSR